MTTTLPHIYHLLHAHFGAMPHWWPIISDDPPFEQLLGAIIVQQTRWETVEQAIARLHAAAMLRPAALAAIPPADSEHLALLLKPAAFYRQKARGISTIASYLLQHYGGSTAALLAQPTAPLRAELLALPRIGNETADVTMLYGGDGRHAVFVVDEYTRRLFERVQPTAAPAAAPLPAWRSSYATVQAGITAALPTPPPATSMRDYYATYHALINEQCVRYCVARRPRCDGPPARRVYSQQAGRDSYLHRTDGCPLRAVCAYYQQTQQTQG